MQPPITHPNMKRTILSFVRPAVALLLAWAPFLHAAPTSHSVTITCGTKTCTVTMKHDSGADGTTISRANGIACGLLKADGSKKDAADFGPDLTGRNANGGETTYYQTKDCTISASDSTGAVCTVTCKIVTPSMGGSDVSNLLGNDCQAKWNESRDAKTGNRHWDVPAPPKPIDVKELSIDEFTTVQQRVREVIPGRAGEQSVMWVYNSATDKIVLGNALASSLGLAGTPVFLQSTDPQLFDSLRFGGYLGNTPSLPFEAAVLPGFTIGLGTSALTFSGPVPVLINRQSDENLMAPEAIDLLPNVSRTYLLYAQNKMWVQQQAGIPTVSQWGLIILSLLLLTTGTVFILRRRVSLPATNALG